jgi:gliding motility-associated-like protein
MNNNPIEELRRMEAPVTEEGWTSIVNDRRYARKFGHKDGLTPKGRAALIAGAAAVLITVPFLVKTLTHSGKETAQTTPPATEAVQTATETSAAATTVTSPASAVPAQTASAANTVQNTDVPNRVVVTEKAAAHEGSTMASVIAKRQQVADNQSCEDWPPVLTPEPDGSRLTYDNIRTTPARDNNAAKEPVRNNQTVQPSTIASNGNPSVCETTVTADGEVVTKYDYSSEEPAVDAEKFFIPTAFTPNGDGLNDLFVVKANFEPRSFEMTILSRGGDALFQTRDINIGWDGQLHGKLLPQGVYVCIIKYKDSEGKEHKQQGQVLLIP